MLTYTNMKSARKKVQWWDGISNWWTDDIWAEPWTSRSWSVKLQDETLWAEGMADSGSQRWGLAWRSRWTKTARVAGACWTFESVVGDKIKNNRDPIHARWILNAIGNLRRAVSIASFVKGLSIQDSPKNMASPCLMTWWQWHFLPCCNWGRALRGGSVVKNLPANAGDMGSIPGSGRSPGEENGSNPLQCSCLGSPVDRGAWRAIVHGVSKSQTRLRDWTTTTEEKRAGETSHIVPKLQLVRWTPWNLSNLTQDGHKNKTLFILF